MNYKPPGNPKVLELTKSIKDRTCQLDRVKPIQLEELNSKGKPKKLCAWCAEEEIFGGNQKYCSENCSTSAMAWAYPQKEDSLRYLLVRQNWKCAHCKYDYRLDMEAIMQRERANRPYAVALENEIKIKNLPWYYFKRLKNRVSDDRRPEVDHILPIYKGGQSLGLDNHQAICYSCHKIKTGKDLSGKRNK